VGLASEPREEHVTKALKIPTCIASLTEIMVMNASTLTLPLNRLNIIIIQPRHRINYKNCLDL